MSGHLPHYLEADPGSEGQTMVKTLLIVAPLVWGLLLAGCGEDKTPSPNGEWSFSVNEVVSRNDVPLISIYTRAGRLYAVARSRQQQKNARWLNDECIVFTAGEERGAVRLFIDDWAQGRWSEHRVSDALTLHVVVTYPRGRLASGRFSMLDVISERRGATCDTATVVDGDFDAKEPPRVQKGADGLITIGSASGQKWLVVAVDEKTGKITVKWHGAGGVFVG